jgi:large subunit ribosomal protein L23
MALLDFLKNKKDAEKSSASAKASADKRKTVKKTQNISAVKKETTKTEKQKEVAVKASVAVVKNARFSYDAIKQPHISEKASDLSAKNQYIFEIFPNYNKTEIKKAVEGIYGVDVLSVNIIKIPHKKRRLGKTEGFRKAYKKAVVKIKEGQKIEIL